MKKPIRDVGSFSPEQRGEGPSRSRKPELRIEPWIYSTLLSRDSEVKKGLGRLSKISDVHPDASVQDVAPRQPEEAVLVGTDSRLDRAGGSIVTKADPLAKPQFSSELDEQVYNLRDARARIEVSSLPAEQMGYNLPPDADVVLLSTNRSLVDGA